MFFINKTGETRDLEPDKHQSYSNEKAPPCFRGSENKGGFFILIRPKAENFQDLNRFSSRKRSETSENDVFEAKINSLEAEVQKNSRLRRAEYCFPWLYMISDWFSPLCVSEVTSELIIRGVRTCNYQKCKIFIQRHEKHRFYLSKTIQKCRKHPFLG